MKKILLSLLLAVASLTAWSATFTLGDFVFVYGTSSTAGSGYFLQGLSDTGKTKTLLIIPGYVWYDGHYQRIRGISADAFRDNTTLVAVHIHPGILTIGARAFQGCTNLKIATIPSTVKNIYADCFNGCSKLETLYMSGINVPVLWNSSTQQTSGSYNFTGSSIKSIVVGDYNSVSKVKAAFPSSSYTVSWANNDGTANTVYTDNACWAWDFINSTGRYIVNTVTMAESAMTGKTNTIGTVRFASANANKTTEDVTVPTRVYDSRGALYSDGTYQSVYYNITKVADQACYNQDFKSLTVNCDSVGLWAFGVNDSLTTVTLGAGVKWLNENNPWAWDYKLTSFSVNSSNSYFAAYNGALYDKGLTWLRAYPAAKGNGSWVNTRGGEKVDTLATPEMFPQTLTRIGNRAFQANSKIYYLEIPYGVTQIDFYGVSGMTNLHKLVIPATVNSMGTCAIAYNNALTDLYINRSTPWTSNVAASSYKSNITLHVPFGTQSTWAAADSWKDFKYQTAKGGDNAEEAYDFRTWNPTHQDQMHYVVTSTTPVTYFGTQYDGEVKVVKYRRTNVVRSSYPSQATTTIPEAVQIFTHTGFYSQDMQDGYKKYAVTAIDDSAYYGCSAANNLTVAGGKNVINIGQSAFAENLALDTVNLAAVENVGNSAFFNATWLKSFNFGLLLKTIGNYALNGTRMTEACLPYGVTTIGKYAFARDTYLNTLLIPSSVTSIGTDAGIVASSTVQNLIINIQNPAKAVGVVYGGTNAPTINKMLVPVACRNAYSANSYFSSYADKIYSGSFDVLGYTGYKSTHGQFAGTVKTPCTFNRTTGRRTGYGEVAIVRNGLGYDATKTYNINSSSYYFAIADDLNQGYKYYPKYPSGTDLPLFYLVEIADSAFTHTNLLSTNSVPITFTGVNSHLTRIGIEAFYGTKKFTGSATIPATVKYIGQYAFCATGLSELTILGDYTSANLGNYVYSGNASTFKAYVNHRTINRNYSRMATWPLQGSGKAIDNTYPVLVADKSGTALYDYSCMLPSSTITGVTAYNITEYNTTDHKLRKTAVTTIPAQQGVIIEAPNGNHKLGRTTGSAFAKNLLKPVNSTQVNVYGVTDGYYFDSPSKNFLKPTAAYNVQPGGAYLVLADAGSTVYVDGWGSDSHVKGDVTNDGLVTIADANAIISILLNGEGSVDADTLVWADVNGDGRVTIADANAVIALLLEQ